MKTTIGLLTQHFTTAEALDSFSYTNALLNSPETRPPYCAHFWTTDHTVILGMQDQRLPEFNAATASLEEADYHWFVRNSGGLGIVADSDVLNVSLFLPLEAAPTIDDGYQIMTRWIQAALPELPIEHFEVVGSYCPGTFDLSVSGLKFAGMAQRRTSHGLVVMAYLSVAGDQQRRGEVMRRFYQQGDAVSVPKRHFPSVDPSVMVTLATLLKTPLSPAQLITRLTGAMSTSGVELDTSSLPTIISKPPFTTALETARTDMRERQPH